MDGSRKILSLVLAGLLVFANVACACASPSTEVSEANPHAHHAAAQNGETDTELSLCPHQECEDCEKLDVNAKPERDVTLTGFSKPPVDDDIVWIEAASLDIRKPLLLVARAGPPCQRLCWQAETPVRRADLLLE